MVGYSDSDFANFWLPPIHLKPITRRYTTGFVFLCNGTPIAWQSKKQQTVSRSTDEAESQAMAAAASIGMWLRKLFAEIEQPARKLMMFADNKAALEHVHLSSLGRVSLRTMTVPMRLLSQLITPMVP